MPLKIFSCNSNSGPVSRSQLRALLAQHVPPHFCCCNTFHPRQTTHRGLPGNCWKHRPRVFTVSSRCGRHTLPLTTTWKARFLHLGPATVEHLLEGQQTVRKLVGTAHCEAFALETRQSFRKCIYLYDLSKNYT